MKGQFALFENRFGTKATPTEQRPRNFFLPERNRALILRYYYHVEILRKRYDDTLVQLEREFFLTQSRIVQVLMKPEIQLEMDEFITSGPQLSDMKKEFPHFSW